MVEYPPPGRLLDIGGRRLHLQESGQGSPVVVLEAVYKAGPQVAPEWPASGWLTRLEGKPTITLDVDHWISSGLLGTAMHAVNAIPAVVDAAPGIRTFLDLPLITGRHTVAT